MTKTPTPAEAIAEAIEATQAANRPDLLARLLDGLIDIYRPRLVRREDGEAEGDRTID